MHSTNNMIWGLFFLGVGLWGLFNWRYLTPRRYKCLAVAFTIAGVEGILMYYGVLPIW